MGILRTTERGVLMINRFCVGGTNIANLYDRINDHIARNNIVRNNIIDFGEEYSDGEWTLTLIYWIEVAN